MQLAVVINQLNDKGIKYKVIQEGEKVIMAFGLVMNGERKKVEIVPQIENIHINVLDVDKGAEPTETKEKEVDEAGLSQFLTTVIKIRVVQEKDAEVLKQEVEADLVESLIA